MGEPVKNITIVGGGASGWVTACFLARYFGERIASGALSITLIESPDVGIIGVGESTARPMSELLRMIGVSEAEIIKKCDATFKLSGLFANWDIDENGDSVEWVNPFFSQTDVNGVNPAYLYASYSMNQGGGPKEEAFTDAISICPSLVRNFKGPKKIGSGDYQSEIPYSYHLNAVALAALLTEHGQRLGVKKIVDHVENVELDDRGFVAALHLKERGRHPIEFVLDATGFASIIIGKTLGEPFEPYDDYLLNDRAAVMQLPHDDPTKIEPVSRATGMKAGWAFRVPLYNRVGSGYIYSSKFLSDEEAVNEFKAFAGPAAQDGEPRIIRMRIGKVRRSWVKNCLAIGLSSGFVEPLEATAIYSVQVAAHWLVKYFPDTDFDETLIARYNKLVDGLYEEIIDFIALLFCASNREDTPYWQAVRHDLKIPPRLAENLELWKHAMPDEADLETRTFFTPTSYRAALMGKRFYKGGKWAQAAAIPEAAWRHYLELRRGRAQKFLNELPDHYELLTAIRGENQSLAGFNIDPSILTGGRSI